MASNGAQPSADPTPDGPAIRSGFHAFRLRFRDFREGVWEALVTIGVSVFFQDREAAAKNRLYSAARRNKTEVKRFVKFAIVGFSGLVVDYAVLNILAHALRVESAAAVAVAFIVAATNNYVWNILWVYPESRASAWKKFPTFFVVNAVGLGISELILFLFEKPLEQLTGNPVIGLNLTKAIAALIVMMWNFFVNRFVTFRHVQWGKPTGDPAEDPEAAEQYKSAL